MAKSTCTNIPTASCIADSFHERVNKVIGQKKSLSVICFQKYTAAAIAVRIHLFPYRTEKLSSLAPMVLPHQVGE